jgi:CubicO group peptidase (beta-lactamase class C family)
MALHFLGRARLLIALALLVATAHAASLREAIDAARAHVRQNLASKAPGLSIAVGRDGKILWSEGFGFADLAAHKPVTPQTQFRIGSVSKPLTAAGLMLLMEEGKIDLDADIHKYVPDYPDKGAPITTRQLAGHLAGIRHYRGKEFYSGQHYDSIQAGLKIFEDDPLLFKPGEAFSYSSYGFNLISVVMESASQQKFPG